jgi:hypothetical protein
MRLQLVTMIEKIGAYLEKAHITNENTAIPYSYAEELIFARPEGECPGTFGGN